MEEKNGDGTLKVLMGGLGGPYFTRQAEAPVYAKGAGPTPLRKVRVDVLDLSDPVQYTYYLGIWDAVGYSIAGVAEEEKEWVASKENWKIFIRWYFTAFMDPAELTIEKRSTAELLTKPQSWRKDDDA